MTLENIITLMARICGILGFLLALISFFTSRKNKKDIHEIKQNINIKGNENIIAGRDIN